MLGQVGVIWGWVWPSWHPRRQASDLKPKTSNPKPYALAAFACKDIVFLMVLKWHCSLNIQNAYLAEMPESLSLGPCAAKSLFSATTIAKILIGGKQRCL